MTPPMMNCTLKALAMLTALSALTACGGPGADINVFGTHQCVGELKRDVDDLDNDGDTNECIDKGCNKGAPNCAKYDVEDANHNTTTCECA